MTIEKLLASSAAQLEAMSDEELNKHFAPFLDITRPERPSAVMKDSNTSIVANKIKKMNPEQSQLLLEMARKTGIDIRKVLGGKK